MMETKIISFFIFYTMSYFIYNDEFFDGLFGVYDKKFELENYNKDFNNFLNNCRNDIFK